MAEENISAAGAAEIDTLNININVESGGSLAELERLKKQLDAIEKELSGVRSGTEKTAAEMDSLAKETKSSTSFLRTFATVSASVISIRYVVGTLRDFIEESSSYVENMNLFTIAMGEYAEEATVYAETVQDALGLDISEWTRAQGLLMQLATGFGVAREDAAAMSKTLTQLSYDISSYFNISTDEALTKVRSGISGEIEPLRNLGYALDEATLKRVAYDHGIEKSIESMTQAEKAQLRFIAIMEQSGNVMGDLSRTLESPANQLRIIDQEIMQLKRSVGNFLIPMMQVALPLITAIVDELTELSNWLANILGYEMPTFDYSNLQNAGNASGELADGLTDATTAAKKLNSALIGIDELNILREGKSASSALMGGSDLGIDFSQYDYDFLGNASEEARKASEEMEELAKAIIFVAAAFLSVKTGMTAYNFGTALAAMASTPVGAIVLATSALVLLSAAVAMHDEEINDFVDNTGKKLTDFFDSSVEKIDEWSDSWTDVITSDSLENYVSRILKWLSALTEGTSDYIQNTVDSIDAIFEGDLMRVGRNTLKNLALLGVSILETITAPIRLILDGINEVADDLNGWFDKFGWDFRFGEISTDWFSGMREGLRNWGVSDIPTESKLQESYIANPFFPTAEEGLQYYQHIITSSNSGMNMAVKEQTALLLSEAEKIAGLLQENLEKEVSIVIGDEVIGRSNDRYQYTYGEKLNSGSYDGGY